MEEKSSGSGRDLECVWADNASVDVAWVKHAGRGLPEAEEGAPKRAQIPLICVSIFNKTNRPVGISK